MYNQTSNLFAALGTLGVPIDFDPNSGTTAGAAFMPVDINPGTQTRCSARNAYYDPYAARPNLWISTGQTVTQILFNGTAGNQNSSEPVNGDSSVGQGNATTSGSLFGFSPANDTNSTQIRSTTPSVDSLYRSVVQALKRWLSLSPRQNPPSSSIPAQFIATGVQVRGSRSITCEHWSLLTYG